MTTYEFALSDLAARLAGNDASLSTSLRDILTVALQELIEAELTATLGASPGERTSERVTQRNGHRPSSCRPRLVMSNSASQSCAKAACSRKLLEPRRRIDKALWAVIMTAYITGTSTRKVDDLVRALGCDSGISKSTVSRICTLIDAGRTRAPDASVGSSAVRVRLVGRHLCPCPRATPCRVEGNRDRHRTAC